SQRGASKRWRTSWRPAMTRDHLVRVRKPDELSLTPWPAKNLKPHGEILTDKAHGHDHHGPLRRAADKGEGALRRLSAVAVQLRRKSPDRKHERVHTRVVHRGTQSLAIHLFVLPPLHGLRVLLGRDRDRSDLSDACGV